MKLRNPAYILALALVALPLLGVFAHEQDKKKGGIVIEPGREPEKKPPNKKKPPKPPKPLPPPIPPLAPYGFNTVTLDSNGKVIDRRTGEALHFIEDLGDGIFMEMVQVPGGSFLMGSPETEEDRFLDEGPQHEVIVQPFYMSKYEVTQAQWRAIAALSKKMNDDPSKFKGGDLPVEQVSWEEANEFCRLLSKKTGHDYRLPTEAEWEYACRAETATPFYLGEAITPELANYNPMSPLEPESNLLFRRQTTSVGDLAVANAFGLYDMHGNVSEWCLDLWHKNYEGAPADGSAWNKGGDKKNRVMRGGSWNLNAARCRSATRSKSLSDQRLPEAGFRVVLALPQSQR